MVCSGEFPLASPLPSLPSAGGGLWPPPLFGEFLGTTGLSDFPCPFIIGVRPQTSRHVPRGYRSPWEDMGSPGSRAWCFRACARSLTAWGSGASRGIDAPDVALRFSLQRQRPKERFFRGSILGLRVPLSTLRLRPCGRPRMTQGRCGSLNLQRMTLSFTTPCRFDRRNKEGNHGQGSRNHRRYV